MRTPAHFLGLLALLGCASSGPEPGPVSPPDISASPLPAPIELTTSCSRVAELSAAGDHKPAVDDMRILLDNDVICSPDISAAVAESQNLLRSADDLVGLGLDQRERGENAAARNNFLEALALYPRYHWARKLAEMLPNESVKAATTKEVLTLRQDASMLRSQGRTEEALELLERAVMLSPAEPEIAKSISLARSEIAARHLAAANRARLEGRLKEAAEWVVKAIGVRPNLEQARLRILNTARTLGLSLFSAGELVRAQTLWRSALELDSANATLLRYLEAVEIRLRSLDAIKQKGRG